MALGTLTMSEEQGGKPTLLQVAIEKMLEGGLPQVIAGPAGKAISRLISGAADIPAAWLERHAQRIRDDTAARTTVMKAMAEAASKQASASPELIDRAVDRWVGVQAQRQANREQVAAQTIEHLRNEPAPPESEGPSDDWINVFEDFAERASSEGMQDLWSRILAGEIRKPGSFSLVTLSYVSTLDKITVEKINKVLPFILDDRVIPKKDEQYGGLSESDIIELESLEFGMFGSGFLYLTKKVTDKKVFIMRSGPKAFVVTMPSMEVVKIPGFILSRPGIELSKIIPREFNLKWFGEILWSLRPTNVQIGDYSLQGQSHVVVNLVSVPRPTA
jgi:hypothetical protein